MVVCPTYRSELQPRALDALLMTLKAECDHRGEIGAESANDEEIPDKNSSVSLQVHRLYSLATWSVWRRSWAKRNTRPVKNSDFREFQGNSLLSEICCLLRSLQSP